MVFFKTFISYTFVEHCFFLLAMLNHSCSSDRVIVSEG